LGSWPASVGIVRPEARCDRPTRGPTRRRGRPARAVAISDVEVAIVRTEPAFDGGRRSPKLKLHLDAIAAATKSIFARTSIFHFRLIADAFESGCAMPATRRSWSSRDDAKRLAEVLDDGRSPGARAPLALCRRYPPSLRHVLPVAG
jgi:hypothetical protein